MQQRVIWLIVLTSLLTAGLTIFLDHYFENQENKQVYQEWSAQKVNYKKLDQILQSDRLHSSLKSAYPTDFIEASRISTPAVVYIESNADQNSPVFDPSKVNSTGSGVLISPDGYIATNYHVIENAKKIQVLLNDNREYTAKLVGTDPTTDLALIKIEDAGLPYLLFGNSDSLMIGEWVLAVGNPFRLQSTVTAGIISAKARNIHILNSRQYSIEAFIQTDAAVNPGNSGGALVNTAGELVGINTAIMTFSGRYEGYSFSIPANLARKVIMDLKEFGAVQRGLLGVVIQNVDNEIARQKGLKEVSGVLISSLTQGGAAQEAGLLPDDIIVEINNQKIKTVPQLQEIIGRFRPGNKVSITFFRNNFLKTSEVILRNQVNSTELISTRKDKILTDLGFELRDLTEKEKLKLELDGVRVLSILRDSKIESTNMAPGYIIQSVNGKKIKSVNQLIELLNTTKGKILLEGLYENYDGRFPYSFFMDE
ncbi:MAG: trypsin-like peptidase domain-containing protein [Bacteroidota bacterium]|nr:trypsin-like peptidase domain-containing protein [Bacteroidota bacterium]